MYYVWKRNDGWIGMSGYMPEGWITGGAYGTHEGAGEKVTFECLATFPRTVQGKADALAMANELFKASKL